MTAKLGISVSDETHQGAVAAAAAEGIIWFPPEMVGEPFRRSPMNNAARSSMRRAW